MEDNSQDALIILNAVNNLQLGKHKLACFLKGSKSKDITYISQEKIFGGLFWHDIPTIEGFIVQLEKMEFIKRITKQGYPYPFSVYVLTDAGKMAISDKINIPLQIIKEKKPITVGKSEKITLEFIQKGKTISQIAAERSLVESTIYMHLYKLIVNGYLHSEEIMAKETHEKIKKACSKFKKRPPLSEIKAMLPEEILYEEIRCVAADYYKDEKNI